MTASHSFDGEPTRASLGSHAAMSYRCATLALAFCCWFAAAMPAQGATFTVDSTVDAVDANISDGVCQTAGNVCSLRAAIAQANALGGTHTINVPSGTFPVTPALGLLSINSSAVDVTINGTGAAGTVIVDGQNATRMLSATSGATVRFVNVVLQHGAFTVSNPGSFGVCIGSALLMSG